ncbi:MAG: hypothetical protein WBA13_03300 [Microcoleaceae cyanobacterium]
MQNYINTPCQPCKSKKQSLDDYHLPFLIDEYLHKFEQSYHIENQWWSGQSINWEKAVIKAWKSRLWHGKMHPHQHQVAHKLPEGL